MKAISANHLIKASISWLILVVLLLGSIKIILSYGSLIANQGQKLVSTYGQTKQLETRYLAALETYEAQAAVLSPSPGELAIAIGSGASQPYERLEQTLTEHFDNTGFEITDDPAFNIASLGNGLTKHTATITLRGSADRIAEAILGLAETDQHIEQFSLAHGDNTDSQLQLKVSFVAFTYQEQEATDDPDS